MKYLVFSALMVSLGVFPQDVQAQFNSDFASQMIDVYGQSAAPINVDTDGFVGNRVPFRRNEQGNPVIRGTSAQDIENSLRDIRIGNRNRDYYGYENLNEVDPFFAISAATYRLDSSSGMTPDDYYNLGRQRDTASLSILGGVGYYGSDEYFASVSDGGFRASDSIAPMGGFSNPLCLRPARGAHGNSTVEAIWPLMFYDVNAGGFGPRQLAYTPHAAQNFDTESLYPAGGLGSFRISNPPITQDDDAVYWSNQRSNFMGGGHETVPYATLEPTFYGPDDSLRTVYRGSYRCLDTSSYTSDYYDEARARGFSPGREVKLHAYSCNGEDADVCRQRMGGRALTSFFRDPSPPSDKAEMVGKDWADIFTPGPAEDRIVNLPGCSAGPCGSPDSFYDRFDAFNIYAVWRSTGPDAFGNDTFVRAYLSRSIFSRVGIPADNAGSYGIFTQPNDAYPRSVATQDAIDAFTGAGVSSLDASFSLARLFCEGRSNSGQTRANRETGSGSPNAFPFAEYQRDRRDTYLATESSADTFPCASLSYDFIDECHEADYYGSVVLAPTSVSQGLGTRSQRAGCRF